MKKLLLQVTLFKLLIVFYLIYISWGAYRSSYNFFHDNADFGFWTFVSFVMISIPILIADIITILIANLIFKGLSQRIAVFFTQLIVCVVVYFGMSSMFEMGSEYETSQNYGTVQVG